jgi:hypothetical protein
MAVVVRMGGKGAMLRDHHWTSEEPVLAALAELGGEIVWADRSPCDPGLIC